MATRKPIKPVPTSPRKPVAESGKSAGSLTSERISDDLDAFRKAGGRIEVLGNTRVLTKIDESDKKPSP
jgi:hypothetical protein